MSPLFKKLPLFLLSLVSVVPSLHSQEAVTTPVGAMTYSFPATTSGTNTHISVPLISQPVFSGRVLTVGTNTLTFDGSPFTVGTFTQTGAPHFLRVQSGTQSGRMILIIANTVNTLTVDVTDNSSQTTNLNTTGFAVATGDQAQIVPGDTLASFFGDNTPENPVAFVGASSGFVADTISIYNKATARFNSFFFHTDLNVWRSGSSPNSANNVVLYPDATIVITRKRNRVSAVSITVVGEVPSVPLKSKTVRGLTYTSTRYPVDIRLSQFAPSGWTRANSGFTADTLSIYNPVTARMNSYFQRLDGSWRRSNDPLTDQSDLLIPAGSSVAILKRGVTSDSASFTEIALPYSL